MTPSLRPDAHYWQGNQACAEGALAAGCRFFAGYPITPASEIAEIMSQRLPLLGGVYTQMEDELGSIAAIIGASWGGLMSMTATSGPGFSLMQENIGYAIMTETPCVIVDVQRAGPSTGQATKAAQGDFMQSRWGTHGDHQSIVLAPNSAQEIYELTIRAFEISEMLRHPVIILSDEIVSHSRERVIAKPVTEPLVKRQFLHDQRPPFGDTTKEGHALMPRFGDGLDLLVTGSTHDEKGYRRTSDADTHDRQIRRLNDKVRNAQVFLSDTTTTGAAKAKWGVISFGSTSRSVEEALIESKNGFRSLRLRTLWPFPDDAVRAFSTTVDRLLVPELSLGQMVGEVSRVVDDSVEVVSLNKIGGGRLIEPEEILDAISDT